MVKYRNPPNQSKGILDDYAVRKNVATREGTVEKIPVNNNDIANKKYVDDAIDTDITTHTAITDAHHTKYTDAEAVSAVATADDYLKLGGDTTTGDYTFGNAFVIKDSNNKVWVGDETKGNSSFNIATTNPQITLYNSDNDIYHLIAGDTSIGNLAIDAGIDGTNPNIIFRLNGTEVMRCDGDSNYVGIGTDSPNELLEVRSGDNATILVTAGGNNDASIKLTEEGDSGLQIVYDGGDNKIYWKTGVTGSYTTMMTMNRSTGALGIGTTSPEALLDVNGAIVAKQGAISADTDNFDVSTYNNIQLNTASGNIVIGGLSGGVTGQVIHLFKTTSANTVTIENNESTGTQKIITASGTDVTLPTYGGMTLVYKSGFWFEVGH